jgi:transmembrane sensor
VTAAERIEEEASRWLASRDAAGKAANDPDFDRWLGADIRHRVAYLKLQKTWQRVDRLRDLKPLDRAANPDLLEVHRRPWPVALAASIALLAVAAGTWMYVDQFRWQRYETGVGGFSRVSLDDGSIIDLNTNSAISVRLGRTQREVRLERGEGRFDVAPDRDRPFVVSAADANVRALGTAFTVRLREAKQVDVLVSEGRVAIASETVSRSPPLYANEAATVLPGRVSVTRVEPQLLARRLAWTSGRIVLQGETLSEAIAEFNRYNKRQLAVDPSIATLRVGGNFDATDPESFAAALASAFQLRIAPFSGEAIVLKPP